MNKPYLYIGALDLSPYIVRVDSPMINLRDLPLELEQDFYWACQRPEILKMIVLCSSIGHGNCNYLAHNKNGKITFMLQAGLWPNHVHYTVYLRNLSNEWWIPSNPKRLPWRKIKGKVLI